LSIKALPDGRWSIVVDCRWFAPPFAKIPKPLPQSPAALALYLLLRNFRKQPASRKGIRFDTLCQLLGISNDRGPLASSDALNRALDAVNDHLTRLPVRKLHAAKVRVPARYELDHDDDGINLRFIPVQQPLDDDGIPIVTKPKVGRVAIVAKRKVKRVAIVAKPKIERVPLLKRSGDDLSVEEFLRRALQNPPGDAHVIDAV
jgi:hypothetical protein